MQALKLTVLTLCSFLLLNYSLTPNAEATSKSSEIKESFDNPSLIGKARFSWLFFDVYDSYLWTNGEKWSYDNKFALEIKYLRSISKEDLSETSVDEIKRYYKLTEVEQKQYYNKFLEIFPDVSDGDRITAIYHPQEKIEFYFNGKKVANISDLVLAKRFMDIWLHSKPHHKKVSCKLKGLKDCK